MERLIQATSNLVECHCEIGLAALHMQVASSPKSKDGNNSLKSCYLLNESLHFGYKVI